jgi:hypothetical protein
MQFKKHAETSPIRSCLFLLFKTDSYEIRGYNRIIRNNFGSVASHCLLRHTIVACHISVFFSSNTVLVYLAVESLPVNPQ